MNRTKRKPNCESPNAPQSRKQVQRRRNTCPSPQDITRALQGPPNVPSASAASLDELILRCLNCFDCEGKVCSPRGSQVVHMTLMMHSWVVPSQTFAQKLLASYKDCPPDKRGLRRSQVCHLVRTWIGQFPAVFEADPLLEQTMGDLWALVRSDGEETHLIDTSCLSPHANVSQAPSPSVKKRKVSLIFDHMEADEMAEHLSYLEFKNFCNVTFLDYRSYVVRGSVRDNPALERSVMMCNGVSQWVQLMILSRHTAQQRAEVFTKYIHVAQRLRGLQNFNTLMAVTGGLCHSSISRLKDTYNLLPPDVTKQLQQLPAGLQRVRWLQGAHPGRAPQGPDLPQRGAARLRGRGQDQPEQAAAPLLQHQRAARTAQPHAALRGQQGPPAPADDLYYTEDQIYELSYTKEPKNPRIQPVAPVKAPVVAEWGSGVTHRLDPDTISKHVKQMVDSIMKNYDHKQDGFISLEDFEKIAANFPFSFCTHETDRQGEISRQEMRSYFMRGMSVCAKLGYNFNDAHNFQETTYKRPTFCDPCRGFLWGVIKQGYHCKDCGMNCHKHCRDLVGMECVKKHKNNSGSCPCTPAPDSRAKGTVWSSEEEAFVFPHGNDGENNKGAAIRKTADSPLSDCSTQTEPGVWTPEKKERRIYNHGAPGQANTLPAPRSRGCSMPVSFLQEKLEEMHLCKEKSREPD
ncbi:RAS guanyl-releasing protein 4 isoform X3 [Nerophis lumbriciformis]|uniref:RAS guanyl-releasing protein 4 isoform X3 n=1 Tax=Nerophis lumbriciformis TaxID=546530 RepID=UPI002AE06DBD|nr:RAS guanyl-releasing protein 4 isoform X3 [Nerophis lumbriciformis]